MRRSQRVADTRGDPLAVGNAAVQQQRVGDLAAVAVEGTDGFGNQHSSRPLPPAARSHSLVAPPE